MAPRGGETKAHNARVLLRTQQPRAGPGCAAAAHDAHDPPEAEIARGGHEGRPDGQAEVYIHHMQCSAMPLTGSVDETRPEAEGEVVRYPAPAAQPESSSPQTHEAQQK